MSHYIPYRSGCAKLSHQRPRPLDGSVQVDLPTLSKTIKSRLMHSRCSAHAPLLFDFVGRRRTLKPPDIALQACPQGCASRYALRCEIWRGHPRVTILHALQDVATICTAPARLWSLDARWLVRVVLCNMITNAVTLQVITLLLTSSRLSEASLGSSTPYCVIASNTVLSVTVFRRLLLCLINQSSC